MKVKVIKESFVNNHLVYPGEVIEVADDLKLADNLQKIEADPPKLTKAQEKAKAEAEAKAKAEAEAEAKRLAELENN